MTDKLSLTGIVRQEMEQSLDPEYDRAVKIPPRILKESHSFEEFCRRQRLRLAAKWDGAVRRVQNERNEQDTFESRK